LKQEYLRARYYDQAVGRFSSFDSFEGLSASPSTLHKYGYAELDPIRAADPSGNFALDLQFAAGFLSVNLMRVAPVLVSASLKFMLASIAGYAATLPLADAEREGYIPAIGFSELNDGFANVFAYSAIAYTIFAEIPQIQNYDQVRRTAMTPPTEAELATLGRVVASIRRMFTVSKNSSVMVGHGQVDGRPVRSFSRSGPDIVADVKRGMTPAPAVRRLSATDGYDSHADQKQFEYVFQNTTESSEGWLDFYLQHPTGGPMCWNCNTAAQQLKLARPNIVFRFIQGPGL